MTTCTKVLLIVFATVGLSLGAQAAEKSGSGKSGSWSSFQKIDKDGNGAVSQEEAQTVSGLDFAKADKNGDGQLSKSEYESAKKAHDKSSKSSSSSRSSESGSKSESSSR